MCLSITAKTYIFSNVDITTCKFMLTSNLHTGIITERCDCGQLHGAYNMTFQLSLEHHGPRILCKIRDTIFKVLKIKDI